jgi:2-dehydropantoate 2-reductase
MTELHAVVVGAGSMGTLFAARLAGAGTTRVTLFARPGPAASIRSRGVSVIEMDGTRSHVDAHALVIAGSVDEIRPPVDLVILTVKARAVTEALAPLEPLLSAGTLVMPVQNGIDHLDALRSHPTVATVIGASTMEGAALEGPGVVHHLLGAPTIVGHLDGSREPRLERVVRVLEGAGLSCSSTDRIMTSLWTKFVQSCAASSLCGLTRLGYAAALATPDGAALHLSLVREGLQVMGRQGLDMRPGIAQLDDLLALTALPEPQAIDLLRARASDLYSRGYRGATSLLRDLEEGRPTEVDHLMGTMVREADRVGVDVPTMRAARRAVAAAEAGRTIRSTDADGSV